MADTNHNKDDARAAELGKALFKLFDALDANPVDLSWVNELGVDEVIGFELAAQDALLKLLIEEDWHEENDAIVYEESVARSASYLFGICGKHSPMSLMVLLLRTTQQGYEAGQRDAYEGRISREGLKAIAEKQNSIDQRQAAMRAFHEELREL